METCPFFVDTVIPAPYSKRGDGEVLKREMQGDMTMYRLNPDVVARRIRGESILVPIASTMDALDSIMSLNETAEFIRDRAASGLETGAIRDAVAEMYDVEPETAAQDVQQVLTELVSLGVLQRVDTP